MYYSNGTRIALYFVVDLQVMARLAGLNIRSDLGNQAALFFALRTENQLATFGMVSPYSADAFVGQFCPLPSIVKITWMAGLIVDVKTECLRVPVHYIALIATR